MPALPVSGGVSRRIGRVGFSYDYVCGDNIANRRLGSALGSPLVMMVVVMGIFYVMLILPQQRQRKKLQEMLGALEGRRQSDHQWRHLRHDQRD